MISIVISSRALWQPKSNIKPSEWVKKRNVTPEESAYPGYWDNDRTPFASEIMDAFIDPEVETIILMFSAQVVKTEILKNIMAYIIDVCPAPFLVIYPSEGDAREFSTEKLEPMLNGNQFLQDKLFPQRSNSKDNKTLFKKFKGGFAAIAGGNVPQKLARRSVKYLFVDDADRIGTAGDEGDSVKLAYQRTESYAKLGRKLIIASTPTIDGESRIQKYYKQSDQRLYNVPCPYCGKYFLLEFDTNLIWEKEYEEMLFAGDQIENRRIKNHYPETAHVQCSICNTSIEEMHKPRMLKNGKWVPSKPEQKRIRGYFLNRMYSNFSTWAQLVQEYAGSRESEFDQQVFDNTVLAKTWKREIFETIDETGLLERCENYLTNDRPGIPNEVRLLTLVADTQPDRLEYQFVGWAKQSEPYLLEYGKLYGDPDQDDVWNEFENLSHKIFTREDGAEIYIKFRPGFDFPIMIDSGGSNTQSVYNQTKSRYYRGWIAIKGRGGEGLKILLNRGMGGKMKDVPMFNIGVDAAKKRFYKMLQKNESPNKIHFTARYCDLEYFQGATSEIVVKEIDRRGFTKEIWKKKSSHVRNEPLDLWAYSFAAMLTIFPVDYEVLEKNIIAARNKKLEETQTAVTEKQQQPQGGYKIHKKNFVNGWK